MAKDIERTNGKKKTKRAEGKKREKLQLAARWKSIAKPSPADAARDAAFVFAAAAGTAVCTYMIDQAMQAIVTFVALQMWF